MTVPSRTAVGRTAVATVVIVVAVLGLGACGGSSHKTVSSTPRSSTAPPPSPSPTPSPSSTPPPAPAVNPLTGLAPVPTGPVVAVKIDDTSGGRPQRNIDSADIVYIELVEGGLTRLVAVFATNKPTVEAVRSTRPSDPELLAQYGAIDYVASGGAAAPLTLLDQSPLKTTIDDRNGPGFTRDGNRDGPYNLISNLATVSTALPSGAPVQDIGLTWSADVTSLAGDPAANSITTVVGGTNIRFDWNATLGRFVRYINGTAQKQADGTLISTPNVIVQQCQITPYTQDIDVNGNPAQFTNTVGGGAASVFRDGKRIDGTWSRPTATAGTTFTDAAGRPIALAPGGTWIVLVSSGTTVTSS